MEQPTDKRIIIERDDTARHGYHIDARDVTPEFVERAVRVYLEMLDRQRSKIETR